MRPDPFFERAEIRRDELDEDRFPFTVPAVQQLESIRFHPAITLFTGENGSGKSTIIEAFAVAAGFPPTGGTKSFNTGENRPDEAMLGDALTLVRRPGREVGGFFLRSESMFNMASYLADIQAPSYGGNLHMVSHGESFFQVFNTRFRNAYDHLFILDEIESALSPQRQLQFLIMMDEYIKRNCQFIISTHSPILMSHPLSRLYWLDQDGIEERDWRETEHYRVYHGFVNQPEKMLGILFEEN